MQTRDKLKPPHHKSKLRIEWPPVDWSGSIKCLASGGNYMWTQFQVLAVFEE